MNRLILTLLVTGAVVAFSINISKAQCSMQGGSSSGSSKGCDMPGMQTDQKDTSKTLNKISDNDKKLIADFAELHDNFVKMMEINDIDKLKKELNKQNDKMADFHEKMMKNQQKNQELISKISGQQEKMSADHSGHDN